jgi:predicted RNA-binding protein YlqC (UPF0109 family)
VNFIPDQSRKAIAEILTTHDNNFLQFQLFRHPQSSVPISTSSLELLPIEVVVVFSLHACREFAPNCTIVFMTFIAKKMSETNCASCHSNHRPPHLIFCEEDNGKGGGEVDNHEEDDDISNSLGSIDDRDPRPTKTHHNHEDEDDKHLLRKGKKEVEKRTNEDDKDDDDVKQGDKNSHSDNNPESTVSATLSSSDRIHAADAVTEQILSPAMMISTSNTSTTAAAAAEAANALITTTTIDEKLESPVGTNKCNNTSSSTEVPTTRIATHDHDDYREDITERNELPVLHVGRVIGKGGEMIRDLQARSGCRIDVDQNVTDPHAPRHIIYHGQNQGDIDFAKRLVAMVCQSNNNIVEDREQHLPHHNYHPIELPLGKAVRRYIQVHKSIVGRIIGRGGDMIRDLQIKSHARIQVDHKGEYSVDVGGGGGGGGEEEEAIPTSSSPTSTNELEFRQVMITGTEESVQRAEEMILHLSNRHIDEFESRHQQQHDQQQQQNGMISLDFTSVDTGMDPYWDRRSFGLRVAPFTYVSGYGGNNSPLPLQRGSFPVLPWNASGYFPNPLLLPATSTMIETEIIPCARENIGHVIGRRGVTVNDLQWRSGCNIQLDRRDCKISISGSRQGIELAKNMIFNIFEYGPTHMYAGGRQDQFNEQEQPVAPRHEELVPPVSSQSAANQYPYSRPMMPQRRECYPRLPQTTMMMYGQLPQQQVFPPQQLLQPPIQDPSPALPEAAAEVSYLWREAITMDGRMYYYNTNTMETRWDKPE